MGAALPTRPVLNGTVEYFHWSPTGRSILLGLAGFGADLAGIEGGGRTVGKQDDLPTWLPEIETADAEHVWRSLWVLDTATGEQRRLDPCRPQSVGGHLVRRGAGRGRRLRVALGGQLV